MIALAEEHGLLLIAGATHPFADWRVQEIYPDPRYAQVVEDLQLVARANLIFGLHVHVGIEDREAAIRIMNSLRYFLPHILALSTNSPFWLGMDTGYKSYRAKVFENFPRTNLPDSFASYSEFENYVNLLIKTNSIDNAKKIWWDVRPHPFFDTVEVRICDIPLRAHETIAIAALIQATACKLWHLHSRNLDYRQYSRALLMENKFRAVRYGLDGKMIDFGKQVEVPARELILEYLAFVDDVLDELGSRKEIAYIHTMLHARLRRRPPAQSLPRNRKPESRSRLHGRRNQSWPLTRLLSRGICNCRCRCPCRCRCRSPLLLLSLLLSSRRDLPLSLPFPLLLPVLLLSSRRDLRLSHNCPSPVDQYPSTPARYAIRASEPPSPISSLLNTFACNPSRRESKPRRSTSLFSPVTQLQRDILEAGFIETMDTMVDQATPALETSAP